MNEPMPKHDERRYRRWADRRRDTIAERERNADRAEMVERHKQHPLCRRLA